MAERRMAVIALLLCLCILVMPCKAQAVSVSDAKEPISVDEDCALTLSYTAVSRVPVRLFRVADISASARYSLTDAFAESGLQLNGICSSAEWDVIRSTLESYISANAVTADLSAVTDHNGCARFEPLEPGLYFLAAVRAEQNGLRYFFDSALIVLPGLGEDGLWQYEVAVTPKSSVLPPLGPGEIQYKIIKLWKDENGRSGRPQSIEAELFRDGVSDRTVTLSEETNWSYTWTAEDDGSDWTVAERNVPAGYTVTVEKQDTAFILTNTLTPAEPLPDTPQTDSPDTGDTPYILLYTVLMYASGISLLLLGLTGKKKRT